MTDDARGRFRPGDRVLVIQRDPVGHTRAPRYVRGRVGSIVEQQGAQVLPDRAVGSDQERAVQPVYAVRFAAGDLFGTGDHGVTVNLWESYLEATEA